MKVTVLYFAAARDRAETAREALELVPDGMRVSELLERLVVKHPGLKPLLPYLQVAVNQEIAHSTDRVPDGAEVALLPPVSGGSGERFQIRERPLVLDEVVQAVSDTHRGAVVTFVGAVRIETKGKRVLGLSYEAYAPMAERELAKLGEEISARWPGTMLAVHHRVGDLSPGDVAVVVAAASPHRGEAFAACWHAIEQLKRRVPVWKREQFEDGEVWVGDLT